MADFKSDFQRWIGLCNEEYLIKYANKGLYNRACKEIEKGVTVSYEFMDDHVRCALSDDSVCLLYGDIERFSCSCPSDKICKHVILAIVAYATQHQPAAGMGDAGDEPAVFKPDFGWLLQLHPSDFLQAFTAAQIEEVLFRLEYGEALEVAETSFLTVTLQLQQVEVSFDQEADLSRAMCSCKAKGNCIHKLECLLRYRLVHEIDDREALQADITDVSYDAEVAAEARALLAEVLGIGLAKLPETVCTRFELLAIAAHNGNLPALEKDLRGIKGELGLFFQRHVKFSQDVLLDRLARVYLGLAALEKSERPELKKQLLGSFKSKYHTVPHLTLYALGANPWETRSGYKGVTYYFFSLADKRIYTYTEARPVFYEGTSFTYATSYKSKAPWGGLVTMEELSHSQVSLTSAKTNREQRLSSSDETKLVVLPRENIEELDLGETLCRDLAERMGEGAGVLFEQATEHVFLLPTKSVLQVFYEAATQQLIITVEAHDGESIPLVIPYQGEFDKTIRYLENNKRLLELRDVYWLVQVRGDELYPISMLQGKSLTSLKLDL
ncbi:SWIM zinc finger family protein [Brevibacillus parabrevis]|jgi:SWIM zinc finger.|uniref:SWIM zinc finger family protein n=1 Tax=Brevibacillus parabrevis TaxID=54914 RepID=UPI00249051B0|nr:SWIM zinc finger family protein [Brevibacillus parabrevis]